MLRISWRKKVTNEQVLVGLRANEARIMLKIICHRKHRWLGHFLRHDNVFHGIIEGKMLGKGKLTKQLTHVFCRTDRRKAVTSAPKHTRAHQEMRYPNVT